MDLIKKNKTIVSIAIFVVVAAISIVVMTVVLKQPVVPVCVLVLIEAAIAVMLHNAELWIHGVLLLAEIIAGVALGRIVLVLLCILVYIAATFTLKLFDSES
ncbi:MAG: hypothetical protein SOW32_05970 [Agathobacter sp.]|nr:hypothetical protein [Agathobacter sp.]MDY3796090.1 hypothetical protein [Agathobacter sp.]